MPILRERERDLLQCSRRQVERDVECSVVGDEPHIRSASYRLKCLFVDRFARFKMLSASTASHQLPFFRHSLKLLLLPTIYQPALIYCTCLSTKEDCLHSNSPGQAG